MPSLSKITAWTNLVLPKKLAPWVGAGNRASLAYQPAQGDDGCETNRQHDFHSNDAAAPPAQLAESSPLTSSPSGRVLRVPLEFWLGPFLLSRWQFRVVYEDFYAGPEDLAPPPVPDLDKLADGAQGLYRRSQPLPSDAPPTSVPGWIAYVVNRNERQLIDLRQSFEEYLRHFSRKARVRVKGEVRRFSEAAGGSIDWRIYRTVEEIQEFHRLARDISQRTYQEKLFDKGMPAGPDALEKLRRLAAADRVRGYILFWQRLPISYIYCPAVGNHLILGYLGFRPEFAKHSPGTVLMFLAVESLFVERRFDAMHLGGGKALHKRVFATHTIPSASVLYLQRTPGNLIVVASHRQWQQFSKSAVDLVDRIGVKQRLRRWIRGQRPSPEKAASVDGKDVGRVQNPPPEQDAAIVVATDPAGSPAWSDQLSPIDPAQHLNSAAAESL